MTIDEIKRQIFIDSEEVCGNTMIDIYQAEEYVEQAYNKAIDDLLEDANEMAIEVDADTYTMKAIGIGLLENIAEQLKAGGKNELSEHSKS